MRKQIICIGIVLLLAGCRSQTSDGLFSKSSIEQPVPVENIVTGMPVNPPAAALYPGVSEADIHSDTSRKDNYFYTTDASVADVAAHYSELYPATTLTRNGGNTITLDIEENGYRTNIFISTEKPTVYAPEYLPGVTFVVISYNLAPLPKADDVLSQE